MLVCCAVSAAPATVDVTVFDQAKQPVPGVHVRLENLRGKVSSAITDAKGQA
jgi:hypothetical protein